MPDLSIAFGSAFGAVAFCMSIVLIAWAIRDALKRRKCRTWWRESRRNDGQG
jgi:hypothetical protein